MFSVVKQGREILKVHFMRVVICLKVRIPVQNLNIYVPNVRRNDPFNKILQITIIEAIKQQIPEAVL